MKAKQKSAKARNGTGPKPCPQWSKIQGEYRDAYTIHHGLMRGNGTIDRLLIDVNGLRLYVRERDRIDGDQVFVLDKDEGCSTANQHGEYKEYRHRVVVNAEQALLWLLAYAVPEELRPLMLKEFMIRGYRRTESPLEKATR